MFVKGDFTCRIFTRGVNINIIYNNVIFSKILILSVNWMDFTSIFSPFLFDFYLNLLYSTFNYFLYYIG